MVQMVVSGRGWTGGFRHINIGKDREYWTIYRGPGFLAVVWFGSSPALCPLSRQHTGRLRKRDKLLMGEGEGDGREQESLVFYKSFNTLWVKTKQIPYIFLSNEHVSWLMPW
jgi:hypothetical protein